MDVRAYLRSSSFPSFRSTIDEALSRGFRGSQFTRDCLQGIPPLLIDDEISLMKKELESVKKELESEKSSSLQKDDKISSLTKELQDVQEKYDQLQRAPELREILSMVIKSSGVNSHLMKKARRMYRAEFQGMKTPTYTATIRKLLEAKGTMHKLNCLREVAKAFRSRSFPWWDEKKGEQFYILCKEVAGWNGTYFHPKIEGVTKDCCMDDARNGLYKFDGVDVGPFVMEVLHARFTLL